MHMFSCTCEREPGVLFPWTQRTQGLWTLVAGTWCLLCKCTPSPHGFSAESRNTPKFWTCFFKVNVVLSSTVRIPFFPFFFSTFQLTRSTCVLSGLNFNFQYWSEFKSSAGPSCFSCPHLQDWCLWSWTSSSCIQQSLVPVQGPELAQAVLHWSPTFCISLPNGKII